MEEYLRIGTSYYKKVKKPQLFGATQITIIPWTRQAILDDYGKDYLLDIARYEGFVTIPSHTNYQQVIDGFYNKYHKLSHKVISKKNECPEITYTFLQHIFGDQLSIGLDYLTILWRFPTQILPILCLVSEDRSTGKTTFLNWLSLIYQENLTLNTNEDFRNKFNSDWADKLLICIDEVLLDKREDSERLKNLSTSKTNKVEAKGKDKYQADFFSKFILCSNNEHNFILIDDKEIRYWVRKIKPLNNIEPNFFEKLEKELPLFLNYLSHRQIISKKKSRMWFTPNQIYTEALGILKRGTKRNIENELLESLGDMFYRFEVDTICLTSKDIQDIFNSSGHRISKQQISQIVEIKWKLERTNSSYKSYYVSKNINGQSEIYSETQKGRYYTFDKNYIDSMLNVENTIK